jgi:hypothetical protein
VEPLEPPGENLGLAVAIPLVPFLRDLKDQREQLAGHGAQRRDGSNQREDLVDAHGLPPSPVPRIFVSDSPVARVKPNTPAADVMTAIQPAKYSKRRVRSNWP